MNLYYHNCILFYLFLVITSFPRLFYLSASDKIQFVDSNESQFNTFAVFDSIKYIIMNRLD